MEDLSNRILATKKPSKEVIKLACICRTFQAQHTPSGSSPYACWLLRMDCRTPETERPLSEQDTDGLWRENLHKTKLAHKNQRMNRDTLPQSTLAFFAPLLAVVLVSGYPISLARDTSSQLETGTTEEEIYPTWLPCS